MTTMETNDGLIRDLVKIVTDANNADEDLSKAKDKAGQASDRTIESFVQRVSAINGPILGPDDDPETTTEDNKEEVARICEDVAKKVAQGNASVKKTRKSEYSTLIRTREHASETFRQIKTLKEARVDDDELKPLNLRSHTLAALRVIKNGKALDADDAVAAVLKKHDHVEAIDEKCKKQLDSIAALPILQVDDIDGNPTARPIVAGAFSAIMEAIRTGDATQLEALEALAFPRSTLTPEEQLLADAGLVQEEPEDWRADLVDEPVDELIAEAEDALSRTELFVEADVVADTNDDDDELDLDAIISGVI